jgi:hypothetical protein
MPAALRGADLVMVAALSNYLNQVLAVAPEFTGVKQLKGKRIAIQRLGDLTHIAAREALKYVGLAESDLFWRSLKSLSSDRPSEPAAVEEQVVRAGAGRHSTSSLVRRQKAWIPACAGMTKIGVDSLPAGQQAAYKVEVGDQVDHYGDQAE